MSSSTYTRRPRRNHRRRRRSLLPILLFLIGLALLIFLLVRVFRTDSPTNSVSGTDPSDQISSAPSPSAESLPPLSEAPWQLTLANKEHPLPDDWEIETTTLSNGLAVDSRIYEALTNMLNDCKAAGLSPIVCSAYRTISRQTELFEAKINELMGDGLSYDEAYTAAASVVAVPGTSEHNLGLAVDICALDYQLLDDAQADTPEQKWLMEHCAEYGFILRYPQDKEDITGIIWEPWHYRYVGVEIAKEITESGLCLEEYLALHYELS